MCINLGFNELSTKPLFESKYTAHLKMMEFARTAKAAKEKDIKHIKSYYSTNYINLTATYTMYDWLFVERFSGTDRNSRDFLQSMITIPYIGEDKEDEYLSHNYFFEDIANSVSKQKCIGLAAAYLYDDLSISLQNGDAWQKNRLKIIIEENNDAPVCETVLNVYSSNCFSDEDIIYRIQQANNVHPVKTKIPPNKKNIHISHHHGEKELKNLWKKILNNPYVESARSIKWGGNNFIRKIGRDGEIEIVLTDTDSQYALQVQTTGRTYLETKFIANILEENHA